MCVMLYLKWNDWVYIRFWMKESVLSRQHFYFVSHNTLASVYTRSKFQILKGHGRQEAVTIVFSCTGQAFFICMQKQKFPNMFSLNDLHLRFLCQGCCILSPSQQIAQNKIHKPSHPSHTAESVLPALVLLLLCMYVRSNVI